MIRIKSALWCVGVGVVFLIVYPVIQVWVL
jgi:hypothetical protein